MNQIEQIEQPPVKAPGNRLNPVLLVFLIFPLIGLFLAVTIGGSGGTSGALQPPPAVFTLDLLVGKVAPDFTLNMLDGQPVTLSSLRGKIVFLNFWATWCKPCQLEMPEFQAFLDDKTQTKATILAVNQLEDVNTIQQYYKDLKLSIPTVLDKDGTVRDAYQVVNLPRTYVIDASGVIKAELMGTIDVKVLNAYIAKLSTPTNAP